MVGLVAQLAIYEIAKKKKKKKKLDGVKAMHGVMTCGVISVFLVA